MQWTLQGSRPYSQSDGRAHVFRVYQFIEALRLEILGSIADRKLIQTNQWGLKYLSGRVISRGFRSLELSFVTVWRIFDQ
jgi:hypothetical protein